MFKCLNCSWKGNELSSKSKGHPLDDKCPICGYNVSKIEEELNSNSAKGPFIDSELDLNKDGKVDELDSKLAGKVLAKSKKRK